MAAIAGDTVEKVTFTAEGKLGPPLRMLLLRDMGVSIGEDRFVEELADDCADDGVYEFLVAAQALRVAGGVGSPATPLAIK